jgi:hypothetical protein
MHKIFYTNTKLPCWQENHRSRFWQRCSSCSQISWLI